MRAFPILLTASFTALLLGACATAPVGETPIEQAQRRLAREPPVLVAEGCLYRRNLASFNHYIVDESRQLAQEGAQELMAAFKEHGIDIRQFVVPLMCATPMPPRGKDKEGEVATGQDTESLAEKKPFPQPLDAKVEKDETLRAAYAQLFGPCESDKVRKENRYDCPLLQPAQAALLKQRLKSPYLVVLSVGGDRASAAHRGSLVALGLLLGFINIPQDAGTARVRVVNLETGALIYSSFPGEFLGQSPASIEYDIGGGRSRYADLKITAHWAERMIKPLFEPQR